MSLICSFDTDENRHNFYREKDCIEKFCEDLKVLAIKIISYEEKEMVSLPDEEIKSYEKQKECYICKKEFCTNENKENQFKLYKKVRDHCHFTGNFRGAAHNISNLRYKVPKEIPVVIHTGLGYDYHFIIKQLAEQVKGQFECFGENTEKYITFSVPIKKGHDSGKTTTYKLIKFIDSYRFMPSKLSDLIDNLSGINNNECKSCMERKKIKSECNFIGLKNNRLNYKCKECGKKCSKLIHEAIKDFPITYQFCNGNLNKFVLLLRKGIYPYEYMDTWERFNETSLADKRAFYSESNLEDITNKDYVHAQKVREVFEIKNLGEYHDLYVQCDTLLLPDVFENFRDKCIEIYGLDPAHFLSEPGLAWQVCFKKTGVNLKLLTNIDILLMAEKIRGGLCQTIHRYAKANNK